MAYNHNTEADKADDLWSEYGESMGRHDDGEPNVNKPVTGPMDHYKIVNGKIVLIGHW